MAVEASRRKTLAVDMIIIIIYMCIRTNYAEIISKSSMLFTLTAERM